MTNQNKRIKIFILLSASALILFILALFIPARAAEIRNPEAFANPPEIKTNTAPDTTETAIPIDTTADGSKSNPEKNQPSGKYAALTFDDGPRRGTTDILLNGLRERGVRATFFLIGQEAESNPELALRIKSEGHQIGNHTWSHARLDELSDDEMTREISRTDALLRSILGPGEYWLRPPYGFIRAGTENFIPVPMITWSVDPRDWESRDTEKIVQSVLDSIEPGSIILLHDIYPASVDAALKLIDELSKQDYEFVTVQELFSLYDIQPEAGVKYRGAIK